MVAFTFQLLKCLFGSNVMALFEHLGRKGSDHHSRVPADPMGTGSESANEGPEIVSLHQRCFTQPLAQLEDDLTSMSEARQDSEPIR